MSVSVANMNEKQTWNKSYLYNIEQYIFIIVYIFCLRRYILL